MQTWFITGASGGLASRITRRLLDRGDRVAATVRKPGVLDDLQAQYGSQLWQANLDLTNSQQIAEVVERAFSELGTIDVFVNNAAYGLYGAVEEASDRQIEHQFMTNVLGSLRAARAVLPFFRKQGGGHVVQISSMAGHYSIPGMGLYCSSKWAVEGAFEALAKEVAPFNIKTSMVEPGGIRTNFITSNAVFGERMDEYRDTEAGQFVSLMKGELPGIDMSMFNQMVVGDLRIKWRSRLSVESTMERVRYVWRWAVTPMSKSGQPCWTDWPLWKHRKSWLTPLIQMMW
ncbi:SDR family NAD(P)-dependent oxidoreductase [Paenibacillus sp. GYB003]|uniref:SDR family NAD(P)-dependent oxidoreductase n=1 Tax=Paenibacillus sp. GYB003 TaxID=2994392 RepID=UPI002F96CBA7